MTAGTSGARKPALVPAVPYLNTGIAVIAACAAIVIVGALGMWGFDRRAVD